MRALSGYQTPNPSYYQTSFSYQTDISQIRRLKGTHRFMNKRTEGDIYVNSGKYIYNLYLS